MERVILHIGLRKTASTFLQHNVFPYIPEVLYKQDSDLLLSYNVSSGKKILLISNEDIPGWPYYLDGVHKSFFDQFKYSINLIKKIFKNPKIIVCFREPGSFIYSNYKQYLHEGGVMKWEDFFSLEDGKGLLNKEDYFFSKYVTYLFDNFNEEDICIYEFENFKNNNYETIIGLVRFIMPDHQNFEINLKNKRRSNPAVNYRFENTLIKLNEWNKYFIKKKGIRLQIRLFGKLINPRVLCQYIFPKFLKKIPERDLQSIHDYYREDWNFAQKIIHKKLR